MFAFLKQSTASQSRLVGPFVDDTDFKTAETGLTIANTDVKLSKNGAAGVDKNSGGGTHRNNGMYSLTFDATDTNTVGELTGSIAVAGALVVTFKFWVLEEAAYDDIFGASADPFTVVRSDVAAIHSQTTVIESDTTAIHSQTTVVESDTTVIESDTTAIHSDTTIIASDVVIVVSDTTAIHSQTTVIESDSIRIESDTTAIHSDTTIIASDVVQVYSDTTIVVSDTTAIHSQTTVIESDSIKIESDTAVIESDTTAIHSQTTVVESDTAVIESDTTRIELALVTATGTLEATPSSTVLQTSLAETTNDHYNNMVFVMTSGDEAGEARRIDDYTGATGTITLKTALSGAPTAGEAFVILNIPVYGDVIYSDTTIVVSDTTRIESDTTVIESDTTAIHSDTTIIASDVVIVVSDTTAIHSQTTVIESDTAVVESDTTAIHSDTTIIASDVVIIVSDTTAIHSQTTVVESDTTKIESDVALLDSAHSEPTGVPAANETPIDKLGYLFMALRNKVTVTATKKQFYDDGDTAEWEKDLTDDGTTYTETEGNAI